VDLAQRGKEELMADTDTQDNQDKAEKQDAGRGKNTAETGGNVGSERPTQPAEEWGERLDTGKSIARGGKTKGKVPGAVEEKRPSK
jgi:hypothetical protein